MKKAEKYFKLKQYVAFEKYMNRALLFDGNLVSNWFHASLTGDRYSFTIDMIKSYTLLSDANKKFIKRVLSISKIRPDDLVEIEKIIKLKSNPRIVPGNGTAAWLANRSKTVVSADSNPPI